MFIDAEEDVAEETKEVEGKEEGGEDEMEGKEVKIGPGRHCSPRHQTLSAPSFLKFHGSL
jgi:hypothetical protein